MISKKIGRGFGFAMLPAVILALAFTACQGDEAAKLPPPPDTWIAIEGAPFENTVIQKVAFGDNTFVATGKGGSAWYSGNGITWKASTGKEALGADNLSGLTFGNGKFLTTGGSSKNTVRAYSADGGVTWTASGGDFNAKGLAYGKSVFLTGGSEGRIAWSTNPAEGASWKILTAEETTFNAAGKNGFINSIAFGDGKFVAAGSDYGHAAYSTTDGRTWTGITQTEEIFNGWINGIAYGDGRFVAVGEDGKAAYASSSAVGNWTAVADTKLTGNINAVAYGGGHFVAVDNSGAAAWSSDGITWMAVADTKFGSDAINGVTWGGGKFIIVGANGKAAYALTD